MLQLLTSAFVLLLTVRSPELDKGNERFRICQGFDLTCRPRQLSHISSFNDWSVEVEIYPFHIRCAVNDFEATKTNLEVNYLMDCSYRWAQILLKLGSFKMLFSKEEYVDHSWILSLLSCSFFMFSERICWYHWIQTFQVRGKLLFEALCLIGASHSKSRVWSTGMILVGKKLGTL